MNYVGLLGSIDQKIVNGYDLYYSIVLEKLDNPNFNRFVNKFQQIIVNMELYNNDCVIVVKGIGE